MQTLKDIEYSLHPLGSKNLTYIDTKKLRQVVQDWIDYSMTIAEPKEFGKKKVSYICAPSVAVEIALRHIFNLEED